MPRLSDEFINEVLNQTDIIDVVSEKVALSKKGKSYFGLCPFHHEKTPSFSVEPERKIYNCFSCGEKGNAITFLQKTNNISFIEAVEDLAIKANIEMDFSDYKRENPNSALFEITESTNIFYKLYLNSTKSGLEAKKYLENRNINSAVIKYFELGLAPNEFDLLHKTLTQKGYLVSDLFDLGLVKKSQNDNFYDLFRDRIIFPIKDENGNTVAYSGRTYKETDESAKYINSPQTKIFTKSKILYNLHNAINHIQKNDRVLLFEGQMDVVAAYRGKLLESVASMGTSLTKDQIKLIKRYTNNVYICYDGDDAGIAASGRALKMFEEERMNVKLVILPDKLDPDDYINKYGENSLKEYIDNHWVDSLEFNYKLQNLNINFDKMLDIEHFKKSIFDIIKDSSNTIIESYLNRLAEDTKISVESIRQDFNQYTKRNLRNVSNLRRPKVEIYDKYQYAERRLLNYFLEDKKYLFNFNQEFGAVFHIKEDTRQLKDIIEDLYLDNDTKDLETAEIKKSFIEKLTEAQKNFFISYCVNKDLEILPKEYEDFIDALNDYQEFLVVDHISKQINNAPTTAEKIKFAEYRNTKRIKTGGKLLWTKTKLYKN